jgi:hypothetical protein
MRDSERLSEALDRLHDIFLSAATRYDISSSYVSPLPIEEVESVAGWLVQGGYMLEAGALRRQIKTLKDSFPLSVPLSSCEQERRERFQRTLGRIVRLLEEMKSRTATETESHNLKHYFLLSKAQTIFGFKSLKELSCFLDRNPDVEQHRPLTKNGKPHQRRRLIDVISLSRAVSRDDKILSDPVRKGRMEARLKRAQLGKEMEARALDFILGRKS